MKYLNNLPEDNPYTNGSSEWKAFEALIWHVDTAESIIIVPDDFYRLYDYQLYIFEEDGLLSALTIMPF